VDAPWVRNVEMDGGGMPGCVVIPSTISRLRSTMPRAGSAAMETPFFEAAGWR